MMTTPIPPIRRLLVTGLAVVGVLGALTACSGDGADKTTAKPSASASTKAKADSEQFSTPPADIEKTKAECTDGKAVIDQANKDVTLGDCASVEITAGNAVVHLGNVEKLVVSGSINDVSAKTVGSVRVETDGNRVTSDNKPKVDDQGTANVFVTR
jgi:hypothetical protein